MRCNTIRVQSTLRGLRLEEARHQVLRRQEATQGKVLLPAEDRLRSHSVRGCVPHRRRGRRGQDQRGRGQDQELSVVSVRSEGGSDWMMIRWKLCLFCNFFQFCDIHL